MKLHRFVLTLGSNSEPQKHLSLAQAGLRSLGLERLTFSPARESAPISFGLSDALFTDQVAVGETSMELETFAPQPGVRYALVLGNEVRGVRDEVMAEVTTSLEIPQHGTKHSLNVSVAAGIALWQLAAPLLPTLSR